MKFSILRHLLLALVPVTTCVSAILLPANNAQANIDAQSSVDDSLFSGDAESADSFQFKSGLQMQTGQQNVNQSGTLFSNSYANAAGANLADAADRYRLQVFGYQMQSAVRYDGLSINYVPAQYSSGASLQVNDIRRWTVQSSYLTNSQSMDVGASEPESSTWNLAADRQWMRDSIFTHVEYARAQNSDYTASGLSDHAVDMRVDTRSSEWIQLPFFESWNAGAHYRSIGAKYSPAAQIYLPNGLDEKNIFFQPSIRNFTLDLGWREQNQAAIDTMALARSESRAMASLKYTPPLSKDNFLRRVLGAPSLTAHYHKVGETRPDFAGNGTVRAQPLINDIDERGLTLQLAKQSWYWSVQYQQAYERPHMKVADKSDPSIATGDRNSTYFTVGLTPSRTVAVTANAQWHRQLVAGSSKGNSQQLYNVAANFDLVPDAFSVSMQYDYALSDGAVFTGNNLNWGAQNQIGSAALSWRAISFKGSRPAMDLSLKSSYGKIGDQLAMSTDEHWSAQLSMKMYWGQQQL